MWLFTKHGFISAVRARQGKRQARPVVIDEAGLISRAAVAALSLYASKRVVLAGDSKQLVGI